MSDDILLNAGMIRTANGWTVDKNTPTSTLVAICLSGALGVGLALGSAYGFYLGLRAVFF